MARSATGLSVTDTSRSYAKQQPASRHHGGQTDDELTPVQAQKPEILRVAKLEPDPRACDFIRPVMSLARACRRLGFKLPLLVSLCGNSGADDVPLPWWGEFYMDDRRDGQGLVATKFGEFKPEVTLPASVTIVEAGARGRFGYIAIGITPEHDKVLAAARKSFAG